MTSIEMDLALQARDALDRLIVGDAEQMDGAYGTLDGDVCGGSDADDAAERMLDVCVRLAGWTYMMAVGTTDQVVARGWASATESVLDAVADALAPLPYGPDMLARHVDKLGPEVRAELRRRADRAAGRSVRDANYIR